MAEHGEKWSSKLVCITNQPPAHARPAARPFVTAAGATEGAGGGVSAAPTAAAAQRAVAGNSSDFRPCAPSIIKKRMCFGVGSALLPNDKARSTAVVNHRIIVDTTNGMPEHSCDMAGFVSGSPQSCAAGADSRPFCAADALFRLFPPSFRTRFGCCRAACGGGGSGGGFPRILHRGRHVNIGRNSR